MTSAPLVQARTALSPEWDRGFDEAFAELVCGDPDLVQAEFDALIGSCWGGPPATPAASAPPSAPRVPSAPPSERPSLGDGDPSDFAAEGWAQPPADKGRAPP